MITFDIETQPLPDARLKEVCPPFDAAKFQLGEFDPKSVKIGNMRDPEKIKEKIDKMEEEHQAKLASLSEDLDKAQQDHFAAFKEKATLSAAYSSVLAIGIFEPPKDEFTCLSRSDQVEASLLLEFWSTAAECIRNSQWIIGVNIYDFDLPYLIRRSWINKVEIPVVIVSGLHTKWPKWHDRFVDLRRWWLAGSGQNTKSSFAVMANAFGTAGKPEGCEGKTFWQTWASDRQAALEYLEQDVRQPAIWADAMGVGCAASSSPEAKDHVEEVTCSPEERVDSEFNRLEKHGVSKRQLVKLAAANMSTLAELQIAISKGEHWHDKVFGLGKVAALKVEFALKQLPENLIQESESNYDDI